MKKIISYLIGFAAYLFAVMMIFGYGNIEMHPSINNSIVNWFLERYANDYGVENKTINLTVQKYNGKKVANTGLKIVNEINADMTAKEWISHGGFSADEPELDASLRHFYDPTRPAGQGYLTDLVDGVISYFGIQNPQMDAKTWALSAPDNYYNWSKAKEHMKRGLERLDEAEKAEFFAMAYRALGETLHLFADMGCPPHVRNDAHPAFAANSNLYGDWDPYEELSQYFFESSLYNPKICYVLTNQFRTAQSVDELFDLMASFTNTNFPSEDTQYGENVVPNNKKTQYGTPYFGGDAYLEADKYYYKNIEGYKIKMAQANSYFFGGEVTYLNVDCVESQASILLPSIVEGGANVMRFFFPKLEVSITNADNQGNLEGTIKHIVDNEYMDEIFYTGKISIYKGTELLGNLNALNGRFNSSSISLTKDTDITARLDAGGMTINSMPYKVKESGGQDCWSLIKDRDYVYSSFRISGNFTNGNAFILYSDIPSRKTLFEDLNVNQMKKVSWSGNTFYCEDMIVRELNQAVYYDAITYDTVYYRVEGTLNSNGTQILGAYIYFREKAVTYSNPELFMDVQEWIMTYRISDMPMYSCGLFSTTDPAKVIDYISAFDYEKKQIQYIKNYQTGGYDVYEEKRNDKVSSTINWEGLTLGFRVSPL